MIPSCQLQINRSRRVIIKSKEAEETSISGASRISKKVFGYILNVSIIFSQMTPCLKCHIPSLQVVIPPPKPPVPYQVQSGQESCLGKNKCVLCLYDVEHHRILIYVHIYIYMIMFAYIYIYSYLPLYIYFFICINMDFPQPLESIS